MSALSHRVITHHVAGAVKVHPIGPKCLSKKDAQRLASQLLSEPVQDVGDKVIMTEVVDIVQVAHVP